MKKFVFSLESLLKVKKIKNRKLEKDLAKAGQRLEEEQTLLFKLKHEKAYIQNKIEKLSIQGVRAFNLRQYGFYFELICERIEDQQDKCHQIEKEYESIKASLVDIHNQIDMLEKLKQEQYKEYIHELNKAEEKTLEDMVNFKFMTRSEHIYG